MKLLLAMAGVFVSVGFTNRAAEDLRMIETLDKVIQERFADPEPMALGMSRIATPRSFGDHFRPSLTERRDFKPATAWEGSAITALEANHVDVGMFLFGQAIATSELNQFNYRAMKGPAVMTSDTPRPAFYPSFTPPAVASTPSMHARTLPDWREMFPLARKAMRNFSDGGKGFETEIGIWNIAARPVLASDARCVTCHKHMGGTPIKLHQPMGGVLYAFRRSR